MTKQVAAAERELYTRTAERKPWRDATRQRPSRAIGRTGMPASAMRAFASATV